MQLTTKKLALFTAAAATVLVAGIMLWNHAGAAGPPPASAAATPSAVVARGSRVLSMPISAPPTRAASYPAPSGPAMTPPLVSTQVVPVAVHEWPFAGNGPPTPFGQGTYVEPGRIQHVPEYRLRVDDVLELVYRRTHEETGVYRLDVGDRIRIELPPPPNNGETVNREVTVQPDGDITLPYLGPVRAARLTFAELTKAIGQEYQRIYKKHIARPTITPVLIDAKLTDLINTVDSRYGAGGQVRVSRVTPDGSIALPAIGSVPVVGLTLDELKAELSERYRHAEVRGLEVQPVLQQRAPRHVFVVGEVRLPGRHVLEGPTTVMQAIALAGGVTTSAAANLHQVVIFRRTHDWQLIATMVDLHDAIIKGAGPCDPVNDLWVADSDLIVVPKTKILVFDEFVELIFSRGLYGVIPIQGVSIGFSKGSTL